MAGYLDTRQMIIDTLMGRPEGTQIQPEDHQAYALNLLNYVRSVELSSGSTLTGIAEADTVPIEPYDSRVAYITSVPQNTVRTFTYFKKENNEPITITTTNSSVFVILLWNTQYWEYQPLPVTVFENDSFVGYFECASLSTDINKTISSEINQLTTDMRILVKMNNVNTQDNATLQIGLTQSKPLFYNGLRASSTNSWAQGEVLDIYYDGTNYIATTYGEAKFSTGEKVGDVGIGNVPGTSQTTLMNQKGATDLVSEYNVSTNNSNAEYTFAQAVALVPTSLKKGGLTIKYIDSTTHEYAIKRLLSSTWNTTESNWQGIDGEPITNSNNLVKSGGVQNELALGAVYDVSAKNPTAGPNNDGKWESLSALLSDANLSTLIPVAVRKGGMSIKFVPSSDNKYVQYLYHGTSISVADFTNWNNWEKINLEDEVNQLKQTSMIDLTGEIFITDSKNLVTEWSSGKKIDSNGDVVSSVAVYKTSNLINIPPNAKGIYYKGGVDVSDSYRHVAIYDAFGLCLNTFCTIPSENGTYYDITDYPNATLVRIAMWNNYITNNTWGLGFGVLEFKTNSEEFKQLVEFTKKNTIYISKNLFDKDSTVKGSVLSKSTGEPTSFANGVISSYIEVKEGVSYTLSGVVLSAANQAIVGYDSDGNKHPVYDTTLVDNIYSAPKNCTFIIPQGIKKIRFSAGKHDSYCQFEEGNMASGFEPYGSKNLVEEKLQSNESNHVIGSLGFGDSALYSGYTHLFSNIEPLKEGVITKLSWGYKTTGAFYFILCSDKFPFVVQSVTLIEATDADSAIVNIPCREGLIYGVKNDTGNIILGKKTVYNTKYYYYNGLPTVGNIITNGLQSGDGNEISLIVEQTVISQEVNASQLVENLNLMDTSRNKDAINRLDVLKNANVVILGDSIPALGKSNCTNNRGWTTWLRNELDLASIKCYALSGAKWHHDSNTQYSLVDTYTQSSEPNNVIWNQINRLVNDINNNEQPTPDIILIMCGANDVLTPVSVTGKTVGETFSDAVLSSRGYIYPGESSIIGELTYVSDAIRYDIEMLKTYFPSVQIVLLGTLGGGYNPKLKIEVTDLMDDCSKYLGCPCVRLDKISGFYYAQEVNSSTNYFTTDGSHPTSLGAKRLGRVIARQLRTLCLF